MIKYGIQVSGYDNISTTPSDPYNNQWCYNGVIEQYYITDDINEAYIKREEWSKKFKTCVYIVKEYNG